MPIAAVLTAAAILPGVTVRTQRQGKSVASVTSAAAASVSVSALTQQHRATASVSAPHAATSVASGTA